MNAATPVGTCPDSWHYGTTQMAYVVYPAYTARCVMRVMGNLLMTLTAGMKVGVLAYEVFEWTDRIGLLW